MERGTKGAARVAVARRGVGGDVREGNAEAVAIEELGFGGGEGGGGGNVVDGEKGVGKRGGGVAKAGARGVGKG